MGLEVFMKYKVNLKKTKDAIQGYLETVDELTKDKEARYVEVAGHG
jgi:hypothetical protein